MRAFTKGQFVSEIRSILNMAGLPQHHYAGHSFRIGAATSAALAGVGDSTIQPLGRWYSAAFLQYIRMPREQLASLSSVLASFGTQLPQSVGSRPSQPAWLPCCLAAPGPIAMHLSRCSNIHTVPLRACVHWVGVKPQLLHRGFHIINPPKPPKRGVIMSGGH